MIVALLTLPWCTTVDSKIDKLCNWYDPIVITNEIDGFCSSWIETTEMQEYYANIICTNPDKITSGDSIPCKDVLVGRRQNVEAELNYLRDKFTNEIQ